MQLLVLEFRFINAPKHFDFASFDIHKVEFLEPFELILIARLSYDDLPVVVEW